MLSSSCIYLYKVGRPTLKPLDGLPCMTQVLMYVGICAQDLFLFVFILLVILGFGCFPFLAHAWYLGDQRAVLFLGLDGYPRNGSIRDGNHFAVLVGYD